MSVFSFLLLHNPFALSPFGKGVLFCPAIDTVTTPTPDEEIDKLSSGTRTAITASPPTWPAILNPLQSNLEGVHWMDILLFFFYIRTENHLCISLPGGYSRIEHFFRIADNLEKAWPASP